MRGARGPGSPGDRGPRPAQALRRPAPAAGHRPGPGDPEPPVIVLDEPTTGPDPESRLRPFDAPAVARRAREQGVPVRDVPKEPEARALLARLWRPDRLDPRLGTVLRERLARARAEPLPEDVADWIGASDRERGAALHDLLRLADRILQSRPERRRPPQPEFPRFSSRGHQRVRRGRAGRRGDGGPGGPWRRSSRRRPGDPPRAVRGGRRGEGSAWARWFARALSPQGPPG